MKVVYVCSPYRGTQEEVRDHVALAMRISRKAVMEGYAVICPHLLYPLFLRDDVDKERKMGMKAGLKLLELADEVWVADGEISTGMAMEIARAGQLGIPMKCVCDPAAAEEHLMNAVLSGKE